MILISSWSRLCPILWSQVLSREWRCSWSSADRRCSNFIWVINNSIAHQGASYIRDLTVSVQTCVLENAFFPHDNLSSDPGINLCWSTYFVVYPYVYTHPKSLKWALSMDLWIPGVGVCLARCRLLRYRLQFRRMVLPVKYRLLY